MVIKKKKIQFSSKIHLTHPPSFCHFVCGVKRSCGCSESKWKFVFCCRWQERVICLLWLMTMSAGWAFVWRLTIATWYVTTWLREKHNWSEFDCASLGVVYWTDGVWLAMVANIITSSVIFFYIFVHNPHYGFIHSILTFLCLKKLGCLNF